uniref:Uncharacterized protein n=1 Tax=viral metagenome TaxID=1070528 RepID=A0A6C0M0G4_9ZZZZ
MLDYASLDEVHGSFSAPLDPKAPEPAAAPPRVTVAQRPQVESQEDKLSRILRLIEQNRTGYERPSTNDVLLYILTGVVFLFTFDTFVTLGRQMS